MMTNPGKLELEDLGVALQTTELPQGPSLEWLQKQLMQHLMPQLAPGAGSRVEGRPHRSSAGQPRTSIPEFVANLQRFCTQLGSTLQQLNGEPLPHMSQMQDDTVLMISLVPDGWQSIRLLMLGSRIVLSRC